jgi:hypothetical protein
LSSSFFLRYQDLKAADAEQPARKKPRKPQPTKKLSSSPVDFEHHANALTSSELAVQEEANNLLRSEQYSAHGSIVLGDDDSDEEDGVTMYKGHQVRLDPKSLLHLQQTTRLQLTTDRVAESEDEEDGEVNKSKTPVLKKTSADAPATTKTSRMARSSAARGVNDSHLLDTDEDEDDLHNGASIFGQTQGQNATWIECDKCKKWRRLRGVVDEKKLPAKWFCSMNKNDPARARCAAPEESYEGQATTPESAADARARKHFRVWSRRIKTQEAYEARQPPLTRGKKRQVVSGSKDPYEWVRCCNPSCGKWRALLRMMGAKSHVIDRTADGEWYCVMNTWDEKMASCGAPQENLPVSNCPPWVLQDEN